MGHNRFSVVGRCRAGLEWAAGLKVVGFHDVAAVGVNRILLGHHVLPHFSMSCRIFS